MEDALPPFETDEPIKYNRNFVLGIAASVLLHLAGAATLISLPQGPQASPPSVTYIDLGALQRPAPMAAPQPAATQQKAAPDPEATPLPEVPEAPETQPQVQQPNAVPNEVAPSQNAKVEEQLPHTTIGLGLTKGYFKSLGDGESLREGVKGYYLEMLQAINEKWWMDEQIDKRRLAPVVVNIMVARNGEIIRSEIMSGSGNLRYDKAVLAALAAASPLPPLPADYEMDVFQAPIRLVPPLNLMAW